MNPTAEFARLPVVKLPPVYLLDIINAIPVGEESRTEVIQASLGVLNRNRPPERFLDEKTGFRSMVSPTLTHLHFARSRPPLFFLAPNGIVLSLLNRPEAQESIGLMLRDLVELRLKLDFPQLMATHTQSLRQMKTSASLIERIRRFQRYLEVYPSPPRNRGKSIQSVRLDRAAKPISWPDAERIAEKIVRTALSEREVIPIDPAREVLQTGFMDTERHVISSFTADVLLNKLLESGDVCLPITGGGSRIDTGQFRGPYLGLRRLPGS